MNARDLLNSFLAVPEAVPVQLQGGGVLYIRPLTMSDSAKIQSFISSKMTPGVKNEGPALEAEFRIHQMRWDRLASLVLSLCDETGVPFFRDVTDEALEAVGAIPAPAGDALNKAMNALAKEPEPTKSE